MDIDLLSQMVKELILDNDRVALPGLGTFVAELVPATFSDKGYTINPPYRRLSFRPITEDDGLLVTLYSESNNVEKSVAEHIITDFVDEMRQVLQEKKVVIFPGLGRMRATRENNFFFVADEDLDIYPEGLGLAPVSLKTHQETKEELSAAVEELKSIIDEPKSTMKQTDTEINGNEATPEITDNEAAPETIDIVTPEPSDNEEPAPAPEPVRYKYPRPWAEEEKKPSTSISFTNKTWLWIVLGIVGLLILLLLLYLLLAQIAPDFIDSLLYSPEELKILEHTGK